MYFVQIVFYSHVPFNPFFSNDSKLAFFYGESIEKFDIVISKVESLKQRLGRLEALLVKPKVVSRKTVVHAAPSLPDGFTFPLEDMSYGMTCGFWGIFSTFYLAYYI